MLLKYFTFLFLISTIVLAEEKDVLELTDDSFRHEINQLENTLVMFYAPWCGHCKRLKPEYAKAAEMLLGNDPPITLAKVDCTESGKEICNKYSINGYPTLKIYSRGDFVNDYNGPREAAGIAKYMKAQVGPASKELQRESYLKSFLDTDEISVVGFFEKEDSPLAISYHAVSKKLKEKIRFAHTTAKSLLEKEGHKNVIVLYRPKILQNKFEPNMVEYDESMGDILEFINKNYFGIAGVRTRDNAAEFKNPLVVAYYAVDYVKNPKGTNYWRNRIIKVAKDFPNLNFAISSKDDFQHELNDFGIDFVKGDKPVILARNNNTGNVKVAVARNFDEVVTNNDKDTLIEFYAPWCGHCKKLAPIYDELGEKLVDEDVEIVKFDATANDVPAPYEVRGFPTLYWAPKNSKNSPVKYEGGRELDDFIKYIAKHATNELKKFDRKGKTVKPKSDEL
ncbi:Protein disulfide-isomerase A3 [Melipona quadrifasciata]|uniref:protein disulfide-isomerase n=1 Tax=Melipona quadrifasciata TaxID=166423 RepID=A0A0N0BG80_9HYME|nr:Protein disulfide-isomerase A3 [Melipona quadrifasciata]